MHGPEGAVAEQRVGLHLQDIFYDVKIRLDVLGRIDVGEELGLGGKGVVFEVH